MRLFTPLPSVIFPTPFITPAFFLPHFPPLPHLPSPSSSLLLHTPFIHNPSIPHPNTAEILPAGRATSAVSHLRVREQKLGHRRGGKKERKKARKKKRKKEEWRGFFFFPPHPPSFSVVIMHPNVIPANILSQQKEPHPPHVSTSKYPDGRREERGVFVFFPTYHAGRGAHM